MRLRTLQVGARTILILDRVEEELTVEELGDIKASLARCADGALVITADVEIPEVDGRAS